jgi:hypothetical protein
MSLRLPARRNQQLALVFVRQPSDDRLADGSGLVQR